MRSERALRKTRAIGNTVMLLVICRFFVKFRLACAGMFWIVFEQSLRCAWPNPPLCSIYERLKPPYDGVTIDPVIRPFLSFFASMATDGKIPQLN